MFRDPHPHLIALALAALATLCGAPASGFDLEGHRGTRGLAPENTLPAFRRALEIGVTTIETDLAVTQDDVVVISHNTTLNPDIVRGPDGRWLAAPGPPIRALTFAQLRTYDIGRIDPTSKYAQQFPLQQAVDGTRFPQLVELFDLGRASGKPVRFNIETKITPTSGGTTLDPVSFAQRVITVVREANMADRVTVQSFDWRTLVEVRRIAPDIETSCLTMGVDGIITDYPDRLRKVMAEKKLALP